MFEDDDMFVGGERGGEEMGGFIHCAAASDEQSMEHVRRRVKFSDPATRGCRVVLPAGSELRVGY
jgi:hypothetical protein